MNSDLSNKDSQQMSNWWQPTRTDYIMLGLTVLTVFIAIINASDVIVNKLTFFPDSYAKLYPLLNGFHLLVIIYAFYQMSEIKQQLPDLSEALPETDKKKAEYFIEKLSKWAKNYIGKYYYKIDNKEGEECDRKCFEKGKTTCYPKKEDCFLKNKLQQ